VSFVSFGFLAVDLDSSFWVIRGLMFSRGLGLGFVFTPIQAAGYANIAPADTGRASSIFASLRQISASLGVAVLATVLVESRGRFAEGARSETAQRAASLDAFHFSFVVGSMLVLFAASAALLIRDRDVAHTMRRYADAVPPSDVDHAVAVE
jgi:hypothetical protein